MSLLVEATLALPLYRRGKVRDTYDLGDRLLMVATDRVSAFDVVLPSAIPYKGEVLNRLSAFWFQKTAHIIPNHFLELVEEPQTLNLGFAPPPYLKGRSMIVKKAQTLPIECVVRGYLYGSAWQEYQERGEVVGHPLPRGLKEGEGLPHPIFTPTTKALSGHDQPLSAKELIKLIGVDLAKRVKEISLAVFLFAREYALGRGVISADTKLEFGVTDGKLILVDELLTPDSSRFWAVEEYRVGGSQPSYDKQPLRDWLLASGWNREAPAPPLPSPIIEETSQRYRQVYFRLTGQAVKAHALSG